MVVRAGLEPTTYGLEGSCSIQLSYRTILYFCDLYTMVQKHLFSSALHRNLQINRLPAEPFFQQRDSLQRDIVSDSNLQRFA